MVPLLAALAAMALTAGLGHWQDGRALEKDAVEIRQASARDAVEIEIGDGAVDPVALDGRHVVVRGEFIPQSTVYWDNRFAGGVAGMAVVTPLRVAGGRRVVLVDRGVVVPGADRSRLPVIATPAGPVTVKGRAYLAPRRTLELKDNADAGALWQNLTPEKFAARSGLAVHGFILRQEGEGKTAEGLLRGRDVAPSSVGMTAAKHRGYAFQWYSLTALIALLTLFFTFIEHDKQSGDS